MEHTNDDLSAYDTYDRHWEQLLNAVVPVEEPEVEPEDPERFDGMS